jgi:hypothetical protein
LGAGKQIAINHYSIENNRKQTEINKPENISKKK